jgi:hypothetical protein
MNVGRNGLFFNGEVFCFAGCTFRGLNGLDIKAVLYVLRVYTNKKVEFFGKAGLYIVSCFPMSEFLRIQK